MSPPPLPAVAAPPDAARAFVDVTAKLVLVMAALSVLYCVLQLGVILLLGAAGVGDSLRALNLPLSASMSWLIAHAGSLGSMMLLLSLLFLAVSWGLLRRHEWARRGFIVVLVVTALANFAGLPLTNALFAGLQAMFPADMLHSPEGRELVAQLDISRWTCLILIGLTSLVFSGLHGWLGWKFCRPEIRRQFH